MASNYDDLFDAAGQKYNVDPQLLKAVFQVESGGNANTPDSYQGAQGGMQMLPATAAAMGASNPRDMTQAVPAAARYLAEGLDATGTPQGALAYYHGGPDRAQWGPKTAAYVAKGQSVYQTLGAQPVAQKQEAADPFSATLSAPAPQQSPSDAFSATVGGKDAGAASDPFSATLGAPATNVAQQDNTPAPQPMARDLARNAVAGVTDAAANTINTAASPSGTLGKMVGTVVVGAHDALAPYLGYQRFPADVRNMLLGDQVPQAGTQIVNAAGQAIAGDRANVTANTPAEAATRKIVGGAATAALMAPGAATAALAGGAGAAAGDAAAKAVPAWAAPVAELAGNVAGGALVGGLKAGTNKLLATDDPLARTAVDKYAIPLRAGQTGGKFAGYLDSQLSNLPGTGMEASNAVQRTAFNRAVSQTFGENAEKITPQVMQQAKDRIGSVFEGVANRTNIPVDPQLMNDLGHIETMAQRMPSIAGDVAPHISDVLDTAAANNGVIPGKSYQALVGKGSALERAQQSGNGAVKDFANDIREALDDAFQRHASPADAQALAQARWQYKNMMTVAPLVNRGVPGDISPAALQSVANRSFKQNAFKGAGDLGELGDIGQTFLKGPPDSGTATRTMINGTLYGDTKALARSLAGITAGRAAGSILRSNPLTQPGGIGRAAGVGVMANPLIEPPANARKRGQ